MSASINNIWYKAHHHYIAQNMNLLRTFLTMSKSCGKCRVQICSDEIMTIFKRPAVTGHMNVPLELYSRRERAKERKHCLRTTVSKATQMLWSAQRIQQSHWTKKLQKYIWSPDRLPLCWAFSDMLLKLCAFKAVRPKQPGGYGEVCSLHIHFFRH